MEFETVASLEKDGYYLRRFSMGEHSATHINAPNSFYPNSRQIHQYPAESMVVPAVVIDGWVAHTRVFKRELATQNAV